MLSKVSVGSKCLNLERIPNDFLILEEINNICCFQVRFGSKRVPRYLTQLLLSRRIFTMVKEFYAYVEVHLFLVWPHYKIWFFFGVKKIIFLSLANYIHWQVLYWLLLLACPNSYQDSEGSYHRQTERNSID